MVLFPPPPSEDRPKPAPAESHWRGRLVVVLLAALALVTILVTNRLLVTRFTDTTRARAELRLALYAGNLVSELQRTGVVPLLLASDAELIGALERGEYSQTSARLIAFQAEIGTASILLVDGDGRVVGATDRNRLGENLRAAPGFLEAQRQVETYFTPAPRPGGGYDFTFSRALRAENQVRGVVIVSADLGKFERAWSGLQDAVLVLDSGGRVVLATEPLWRGLSLEAALRVQNPMGAIARALRATADWAQNPPDAYLQGEAAIRAEARIPFRGWRMIAFTAYDSVRERVNGILALEIMGFAILLSLGFFFTSRRAWSQSARILRESAELRRLNAELQREIATRQQVQKDLASAEQTLAQSSKLAALGEMSAAVSHELNQPLAAMKTYLAGARLLLERRRGEEALASFQRIDDLIERMGAITRQLKSYARKGGEAFEPTDLRACVSGALSIMEPQLKQRLMRIGRSLPRQKVMVLADRLRLEQVIINILRNALDATQKRDAPEIAIELLAKGGQAVLSLSDNGHGIRDLENLFEPFYTTKKPGEGVGLGLAISSGIVSDHGGRLTARNRAEGGAVFEMVLPLWEETAQAAPPSA